MVDAAIELFAQQGFPGTGVAAIAERAGITPSAVIHHFGSKDAVLQAVLDEYDARAVARVARRAGGVDGLVEQLIADAEYMISERGLALVHVVLQAEHLDGHSSVRERFRERSRVLRGHIAAVVGSERPDMDAGAVATELLAFLEGAVTLWLLDPGTVDLPALYRGYLGRLFRPAEGSTA
ncbi:TetR/AcrR family transcriptional regulator [Kibdelosporangium phytohabitans]|uniref:TetR/AcrR family transcriptional regulator n=1 Tax=Kibdelosporangium phytohabitans TaxID=860235 RepID=UPI00214E856F|nr:TetR/AcrR family transcriptional regulator [Kibdelosporangium phytohabitans]